MERIRNHHAYFCPVGNSIARYGSCRRVEQPAFGSLDRKGRQNSAAVGPRVDADPVRPLLDGLGDGVAMDDDEAVIAVIVEERFADPPQVGLALLVELDARPNAGMDEQIVAEAAAVGEALKELDVRPRDRGANDR